MELVLDRNFAAVEKAVAALALVLVPGETSGDRHVQRPVPVEAPDFVHRVTAMMLAGQGDLLPVSALPVDGAAPMGTAQW